MQQRLFSIAAHIPDVQSHNRSLAYLDDPDLADHAIQDRVVIKEPLPCLQRIKKLDPNDELMVTRRTERWLATHKNRDRIVASISHRAAKEAKAARAEMDRFSRNVASREKKRPPPLPETGGSAWQRAPQNKVREWTIDTTVYLGAPPPGGR
mmetsp:Transcript_33562/g.101308  ORF Transcript_33562/g.101308 Transcript_33562/m.101308 type:complete len:152 (+) Transcript_33562:465-920(+)